MVGRMSRQLSSRLNGAQQPGCLRLSLLACLALAGMLPGLATAQGLPDPTRPAHAQLEASLPAEAEAVQDEAPALGLQAIMLREGRNPLAIINGQTVELNGMLGDSGSRLIRLTETEAVLQGPEGQEVLRLMPEAERKMVLPARSGSPMQSVE